MKKLFTIFLCVFSSAVCAEVTGNIAGTTDYRFRGISQTQNSTALQGGIDYKDASGFYIGNWNSSISSQLYPHSSGVENDLYGGFKKEIFKGVTVDVGSYNYFYPGSSVSGTQFKTNEIYSGMSYDSVAIKYSRSLGAYFGIANSSGSQYWQVDFNKEIIPKLTINAHAGRTNVSNRTNLDYSDFKLGTTYNLSGFDIGAHFYKNASFGSLIKTSNTADGKSLYNNAVIISVGKSF